jgi:CubicO group peptidase (beta-lactamase class C family)
MRILLRTGVTFLFLCLLISTAFAQEQEKDSSLVSTSSTWQQYASPEEAGFSSDKLEQARQYSATLGSAAVLAVYKGKVLAAWGRVDHPYMCHSVRKSFLSALYGIHVNEGNIDLNKALADLGIDDVQTLSDEEKQAKVIHLLKARSGVYHPAAYETAGMKTARPARGSHPPDTFWYYNNWDFNTLGAIFEQVTGKKIFEEFKQRIADPLGMEDFDVRHCYYHLEEENSVYPAYPFRLSARDMARFGQLFLRGGEWNAVQIVPKEWVAESTTSYSYTGTGGYGYMWWTYSAEDCAKLGYSELGKHGMYSALGAGGHEITVIPGAEMVYVHRVDTDRRRSVNYLEAWKVADMILAAKESEAKAEPLLVELRTVPFAGAEAPLPVPTEIVMDPCLFDGLAGEYKAGVMLFTVLKEDDRLWLATPGRPKIELFPEAEDKFFAKAMDFQIVFKRDETGKIVGAKINLRGQEIEATRIEE